PMIQSIGRRRGSMAVSLFALLIFTTAMYLAAGVTRAYFVADDFQWLAAGHHFTPPRIFTQVAGDQFYRPAVDVLFAGAANVCGYSVACYHAASLLLHLLNVSLVFC